jgi:hypothetical protein
LGFTFSMDESTQTDRPCFLPLHTRIPYISNIIMHGYTEVFLYFLRVVYLHLLMVIQCRKEQEGYYATF